MTNTADKITGNKIEELKERERQKLADSLAQIARMSAPVTDGAELSGSEIKLAVDFLFSQTGNAQRLDDVIFGLEIAETRLIGINLAHGYYEKSVSENSKYALENYPGVQECVIALAALRPYLKLLRELRQMKEKQ